MRDRAIMISMAAVLFLASAVAALASQNTPMPRTKPSSPPTQFILDPELERKLPPDILKKVRMCLSLSTLADCEACVRKATRGIDLSLSSASPQLASDSQDAGEGLKLAWGGPCGGGI